MVSFPTGLKGRVERCWFFVISVICFVYVVSVGTFVVGVRDCLTSVIVVLVIADTNRVFWARSFSRLS